MSDISRVKSALEPDFHSQGAYTGRVTQRETFTVLDEDGNPIHVERDVLISWATIQAVLSMVRERAFS